MDHSSPADFNKISPTAFMTSLARQFTDIPYSKEMAELVTEQRVTGLPLILESRYKAINKVAEKYSFKQILELASGFLTRGLEFTVNPEIIFIESDLHQMIEHKK